MSREMYDARLAELEAVIAGLPAEQQALLAPMLAETRTRQDEIKQACDAARDTLADWRIAMKYLIFDLEARLREARPPGR